MLVDRLEYLFGSLVHHGKFNNRLFVLHLNEANSIEESIDKFETLVEENNYTKIIIKTKMSNYCTLIDRGYNIEGYIPSYFSQTSDLCIFAKFASLERSKDDFQRIKKNIDIAIAKKDNYPKKPEDFTFTEFKPSMASELASLYMRVFGHNYPFPIFEEKYLLETFQGDLIYFVTIHEGKIVNACSLDKISKELSDYATDSKYRGQNLSLYLSELAEEKARKLNIKKLFTLARSFSIGMNAIFTKTGYSYGGTLIKNANISSNGLESLNLWYKSI